MVLIFIIAIVMMNISSIQMYFKYFKSTKLLYSRHTLKMHKHYLFHWHLVIKSYGSLQSIQILFYTKLGRLMNYIESTQQTEMIRSPTQSLPSRSAAPPSVIFDMITDWNNTTWTQNICTYFNKPWQGKHK